MSNVWVKSLQCKSTALDDVYTPRPINSKKNLLSCGNSSHALRDVVFFFPKKPPQPSQTQTQTQTRPDYSANPNPKKKKSTRTGLKPESELPGSSIPTLTELPDGHSSRRVVEIIFGSSWSNSAATFPGRIEMLFRVHNSPRTLARFEDYRSAVRSLARDGSRCAVDGNEMMRFHCPSAGPHRIYDAAVAASSAAAAGIRTFAGSGGAHESAGGGTGRRSMLLCRVVAGRMREESVSGDGKGELVMFDARAVLPCFLIIYDV